jgi:hypothetical protein
MANTQGYYNAAIIMAVKKLIAQAPRAIIKPFSLPRHNKLERLSLAWFQANERGYKANQTIPMLGLEKVL